MYFELNWISLLADQAERLSQAIFKLLCGAATAY
jgi:hypothetical protein